MAAEAVVASETTPNIRPPSETPETEHPPEKLSDSELRHYLGDRRRPPEGPLKRESDNVLATYTFHIPGDQFDAFLARYHFVHPEDCDCAPLPAIGDPELEKTFGKDWYLSRQIMMGVTAKGDGYRLVFVSMRQREHSIIPFARHLCTEFGQH